MILLFLKKKWHSNNFIRCREAAVTMWFVEIADHTSRTRKAQPCDSLEWLLYFHFELGASTLSDGVVMPGVSATLREARQTRI